MTALCIRSLPGLPEVRAGDDLAALIVAAAEMAAAAAAETAAEMTAEMTAAAARASSVAAAGSAAAGSAAPTGPVPLQDGEIVAIAHKVVSKAEGAVVRLADVRPGAQAHALAAEQDRDPRAVQVVLDQSQELVRAANGVLICRTHHGFVCANAGVDASNTAADPAEHASNTAADPAARAAQETVIVLPADPDASARRIRRRLHELTGASPAVLISDSFGRAWRHGQCDVAIGCAGLAPLEDWRGRTDGAGLKLRATWLAVADAIAASADLARAKDSHEPVVIVSGLERFVTAEEGPGAGALLRPATEDLFR